MTIPYANDWYSHHARWYLKRIDARIVAADKRKDEADVCIAQEMRDLVSATLYIDEQGAYHALRTLARIVFPLIRDALPLTVTQCLPNYLSIEQNIILARQAIIDNEGVSWNRSTPQAPARPARTSYRPPRPRAARTSW